MHGNMHVFGFIAPTCTVLFPPKSQTAKPCQGGKLKNSHLPRTAGSQVRFRNTNFAFSIPRERNVKSATSIGCSYPSKRRSLRRRLYDASSEEAPSRQAKTEEALFGEAG